MILLGTFVALPVTSYTAITLRPRQFHASYSQVTLNLSEVSLIDLFGREPDCVCTLGGNRILYYSRGAISDKRPPAHEITVNATRDIPWAYGCGQFLFDTKGMLSAFTFNGEEAHITTREGKMRGEDISLLPPDAFERLRAPASMID